MGFLKSSLISGAICFSVLSANAADFFTDKGSIWLGGAAQYFSMGYENSSERINYVNIAPIVRFFPTKYFFVGPVLNWTGAFNAGYSYNLFGAGFEAGIAFGNNQHAVPYFKTGMQFDMGSYSNGFTVPIAGGVIIPLFDAIALQIEPSFKFNKFEDEHYNTFGVSFGFSGIGKRSAISILNGFNISRIF